MSDLVTNLFDPGDAWSRRTRERLTGLSPDPALPAAAGVRLRPTPPGDPRPSGDAPAGSTAP